MMMLRYLVVLLCLTWTVSEASLAQKIDQDPRTKEMPEGRSIPAYRSVQEFLSESSSSMLRDAAVPVGRATIRSLPTNGGPTRLLKRSAGKAPSFELPALEVRRADNGTVRWMNGELGRAEASKRGLDRIGEALRVLDDHADVLRLRSPSQELRSIELVDDHLGFTHARFEQTYNGVPVWGRDLYVHFDAQGEVYAVNGSYEPTPLGVDTEMRLSADAAYDVVVADLKSAGRWAPLPAHIAAQFGLDQEESQAVLYPLEDGTIRPAYQIILHPNLVEWFTYIVDAGDGSILNRIARHCTLYNDPDADNAAISISGIPAFDPQSTATGSFHSAQAVDLNGVAQSLRVYQHTDNLYYKIWDLPGFSVANSTMPNELAGGAITLSANNQELQQGVELTHITSTNNTWTDPASVSAHYNMRKAFDYFRDVHNRKAIDDNNQSLISIIHITENGQQVDNAFWNGRMMIYGNGREVFKPLAGSLDTGGHEMSHGVIQHTANLIYQFQPGALNESFADVFGVLIDPDNMLLGETIMQPGRGIALRDLLNPNNPQVLSPQPAHMSEFREMPIDQDNGGVHVNSGIPNRAAALIMESIGKDKTGDIYYRALAHYLNRNSEFVDARNAVEQATRDLFGDGVELDAVRSAFDSVGIGGGEGGQVPGPTVPVLVGGRSLITFMVDDGRIGMTDLSSSENVQSWLFDDVRAVARVSHELNDRSQLTTGRNGDRIWFVNQKGKLAYLNVNEGDVSVFEDLYLFEPGDIWNASISPTEGYVALVSAYLGDPTIYLFDGERLGAVALEPETSQAGITAAIIEYPDVISWSPDPDDPRLIFDAFNSGGASMGLLLKYWSIYELDLASLKVFGLLPAQPMTLSIGNVSYSSTNTQAVAFNVFENASGLADVVIGDFNTGEIYLLDMPSVTVGGVPVVDALRPTFSPDDGTIAVTTPQHELLLFIQLATRELSYLEMGTAVHNPHWFVVGGQAATDTEPRLPATHAVALHPNYPNPFDHATTIVFELASPGDVEVDVFDLIGRHVSTVASGRHTAGSHQVRFQADGLAPGIYIVRLTAGQEIHHRRIVVVR